MDMPPIKKPLPSVFIPDELIAKILSFLTVKTISQFKCVSKSWKTLISSSTFIKMHLKKSSQNPKLIFTPIQKYPINSVVSLSVRRLLENPLITVTGDTFHGLKEENFVVVGSCNGLVCLLFKSIRSFFVYKYWFCFWNPATRTISEELGFFHDNKPLLGKFNFTFGCDYLTGIYKVVAFRIERNQWKENESLWRSEVRVFDLSDNCWRTIQSFPLVHLCSVYLSGTVNWLALRNGQVTIDDSQVLDFSIIPVDQFVIVSLDLSTEKYTQFLLPSSFIEVLSVEPSIRVLMDCLCLLHDCKRTEFVIWQMKEFGVQDTWTQLFRIEYVSLLMHLPFTSNLDFVSWMILKCENPLLPLYLSKNGDTLILTNVEDNQVIIYNQRDNRVERPRVFNKIWWFSAIDYVESLVSTRWKAGDT